MTTEEQLLVAQAIIAELEARLEDAEKRCHYAWNDGFASGEAGACADVGALLVRVELLRKKCEHAYYGVEIDDELDAVFNAAEAFK